MRRFLKGLAILVVSVVLLAGCALFVLSQWSCCALQPSLDLDAADLQADGTTVVRFSTTMKDVPELQVLDGAGALIAVLPTEFEREVNTWHWQVAIPAGAQQLVFLFTERPMDLVMTSNVATWQVIERDVVGFVYQASAQ